MSSSTTLDIAKQKKGSGILFYDYYNEYSRKTTAHILFIDHISRITIGGDPNGLTLILSSSRKESDYGDTTFKLTPKEQQDLIVFIRAEKQMQIIEKPIIKSCAKEILKRVSVLEPSLSELQNKYLQ